MARTETPDMTFRAEAILDSLPYGHSRGEAIDALARVLNATWEDGYSNGSGDILAAEADAAYRQFGKVMSAILDVPA